MGHIVKTLSQRRKGGREGEERGVEVGKMGDGEEGKCWQDWGTGSDGLLFNSFWGFVRRDGDGSESCLQSECAYVKSHT